MTPQESREKFIDGSLDPETLEDLKKNGMYEDYVEGRISMNTIYNHYKDQAI